MTNRRYSSIRSAAMAAAARAARWTPPPHPARHGAGRPRWRCRRRPAAPCLSPNSASGENTTFGIGRQIRANSRSASPDMVCSTVSHTSNSWYRPRPQRCAATWRVCSMGKRNCSASVAVQPMSPLGLALKPSQSAHQARPQQAHLEAENRPRNRADRNKQPATLAHRRASRGCGRRAR
jgi:hypothetical protein